MWTFYYTSPFVFQRISHSYKFWLSSAGVNNYRKNHFFPLLHGSHTKWKGEMEKEEIWKGESQSTKTLNEWGHERVLKWDFSNKQCGWIEGLIRLRPVILCRVEQTQRTLIIACILPAPASLSELYKGNKTLNVYKKEHNNGLLKHCLCSTQHYTKTLSAIH